MQAIYDATNYTTTTINGADRVAAIAAKLQNFFKTKEDLAKGMRVCVCVCMYE